jgi:hypothetical protein
MCTDCIGSYKSNYHTITTAPIFNNIYCYPPAIAVGDIEIATVRLSAVTIFSSPGSKVHVNYYKKNRNLLKDIPMIIHLQIGFSQFISFREDDLWNFSQSEHIIGPGSHVEYLTIGSYGKMFKCLLLRNYKYDWKPNWTWMFIGWSSTNFRFFVLIWNSKWRLRPYIKFVVWWQPSWISNQQKQKLCRGSPNDQSRIQFGFNEISGFGKKLFVHFLYGPMFMCLSRV